MFLGVGCEAFLAVILRMWVFCALVWFILGVFLVCFFAL